MKIRVGYNIHVRDFLLLYHRSYFTPTALSVEYIGLILYQIIPPDMQHLQYNVYLPLVQTCLIISGLMFPLSFLGPEFQIGFLYKYVSSYSPQIQSCPKQPVFADEANDLLRQAMI